MFSQQVLELSGIAKYFGAKLILDRVSLSINRGDRIGLVGENGTGKTTLARIILGEMEPDEGHKRLPDGVEIGYLPQETALEDGLSIQQFMERSIGQLDTVQKRLADMEAQIAQPGIDPGKLALLLEEYGPLQEE